MAGLTLDAKKTALLIGDFYTDPANNWPHAKQRQVLENTLALQKAARAAGVLVCYCGTVFRPGYPEISDRSMSFEPRKRTGNPPAINDPLRLIHPAIKPSEDEVVVGKHRINAMLATDLDLVLRASDKDTLMILGFSTSGVVLSTVRYAADLDYRLLVVEDCCADHEADVHDFLIQRLLPRQAEIVSSKDVIGALAAKP